MGQKRTIAFLFPGQGAQYPGMSKDFYEHFAVARETFEEANDLLKKDLTSIVLDGPQDVLTETCNSQAGIYVASLAILRTIQKQFPDLKPAFCAGLSLGEYTAVTAAGYLSFAEGLPLVQNRGQFMNDACVKYPGTMAVVLGLDGPAVEQMVKEVNLPQDLWAANFNCPGQVVISGTLKGIAAGTEAAKAKGAKRVMPLPVHGAFHSGLMQEAEERLAEHVHHTPLRQGSAKLVMNVSGNVVSDLAEMRSLLIRQVTSPVRWEQGINIASKEGVDLFVEIGCGKALSGFNKRIGVSAPTLSVEKVADLEQLTGALL